MSVLVDSDILIEVSRGKDTDLISKWIDLSRQDVAVIYSPVSAAELWAGARPAEHDAIDNLFRALTCAAIDAATGSLAGDYLRRYRKSHAVELGDALIAATAVRNRVMLWTRNRKHYPMKDLAFF
jgi:predicted nucleic acid-binding protein